jgi:coatomer subunit beta
LENIDTRDSFNQIRSEFILITDAIRNLILHPNQYIRVAAMRFLFKLSDLDILQQLISPLIQNLSYHEEYVRHHTASLIHHLVKNFPSFWPDISDSIIDCLKTEESTIVIIDLLFTIFECDSETAIDYFLSLDSIYQVDLKLAILQLMPKAYQVSPKNRIRFLEIVVEFCEDSSIEVRFNLL